MASIDIPKPNQASPANQPKEVSSEANLVRSPNRSNIQAKGKRPENSGKTIKGKATKKELTFGEKLKRSFVKEDIRDVRDYIVFDVLIPNAKRSILDMIIGAASQTLGINVRTNRGMGGYSDNSIVDMGNRPFKNYAAARQTNSLRRANDLRYDRYRVTDVIFEYKEDALGLLEQMMDICDQYGWFSVFDFYDRAGITDGNDYTNRNYGWYNVDGVDVVYDGSGYIINLPQARLKR